MTKQPEKKSALTKIVQGSAIGLGLNFCANMGLGLYIENQQARLPVALEYHRALDEFKKNNPDIIPVVKQRNILLHKRDELSKYISKIGLDDKENYRNIIHSFDVAIEDREIKIMNYENNWKIFLDKDMRENDPAYKSFDDQKRVCFKRAFFPVSYIMR